MLFFLLKGYIKIEISCLIKMVGNTEISNTKNGEKLFTIVEQFGLRE